MIVSEHKHMLWEVEKNNYSMYSEQNYGDMLQIL